MSEIRTRRIPTRPVAHGWRIFYALLFSLAFVQAPCMAASVEAAVVSIPSMSW